MRSIHRLNTATRLLALLVVTMTATAACTETDPAPIDPAPPPQSSGTDAGDGIVDAGKTVLDSPEDVSVIPEDGPTLPTAMLDFEVISTGPLTLPIEVAARAGRLYVAEQKGKIRLVDADGGESSVVLDIADHVTEGYDQGILGFTFHPNFPATPYLYVTFTAPHPEDPPPENVAFESVVARYESSDDGLTFDASTEKRILVWDHPNVNHNNNAVVFGPDGFLYIASGDGTDALDLFGHGQNTNDLLGKILRIDVDNGDPYAIPTTNPFAAGGGRPEIYAYGLRNPWRIEFDRPTGRLFAGDVGQYKYEEIDEIFLGGNYGWATREGFTCFDVDAGCDGGPFIDPILVHEHPESTAIVGGVVYRGTAVPQLTGKYVYADAAGKFWSVSLDATEPVPERLGLPATSAVSIRLDEDGEILVAGYASGRVLRVISVEKTTKR